MRRCVYIYTTKYVVGRSQDTACEWKSNSCTSHIQQCGWKGCPLLLETKVRGNNTRQPRHEIRRCAWVSPTHASLLNGAWKQIVWTNDSRLPIDFNGTLHPIILHVCIAAKILHSDQLAEGLRQTPAWRLIFLTYLTIWGLEITPRYHQYLI